MRVLFTCFHPVDPHVVRFIAQNLIDDGTDVFFAVVEKEGIIDTIVRSFGFKSKVIGVNKKSLVGKVINTLKIDYKLLLLTRKYKPDIIFSPTSPYAGHVAKLLKIPHICWADTETASGIIKSTIPFLDTVFIPKSYYKTLDGEKVFRFDGYKEIAYLHPKVFNPDDQVLKELGVQVSDKIILMRFSALNALHDIGLKSESLDNHEIILNFIEVIEKKYDAKVFISMTERDLGDKFKKYKLEIAPSQYVHLLAFCTMYIGEGTTTASEAGVLGVPWINIQNTKRGYLIDQEKNYQLGKRVSSMQEAFNFALDLLADEKLNTKWLQKKERLLSDKIHVSDFITWYIKNYPNSQKTILKNPNYQYNFK